MVVTLPTEKFSRGAARQGLVAGDGEVRISFFKFSFGLFIQISVLVTPTSAHSPGLFYLSSLTSWVYSLHIVHLYNCIMGIALFLPHLLQSAAVVIKSKVKADGKLTEISGPILSASRDLLTLLLLLCHNLQI